MASKVTDKQGKVIRRCQQSVTWFLRNFGQLKHPAAGILPFNPFSYQKNAIKSFRKHRFTIFRKCRQSGISKIAGAFALWFAMFHAHKTVLIVSRRNEDAMSFLQEHVVFLFEHLPQWMQEVWKPTKQNEHEISFPNGSRIQSLTSHPDVLRSHASSLNIIDEAAFIQGMDVMWAAGWPCCRGDTLIQTADGLIKIGDLASGGDPWKDININVMTDEGFQHSNKAFVSGRKPTTILNTYLGFEFEGANHHRIRIIDHDGKYVWSRLDQIRPDDIVISIPGTFRGKRHILSNGMELDEKVAEIVGLYVGDGSLSIDRPKRFRIFFDPQDVKTRDIILSRFNDIFNLDQEAYPEFSSTTANLRINSAEFSEFMLENGLRSKTCPRDAQIPSIILQSDESVLCAFLRGLFDSDGWCYPSSTCLKLGFSTVSEKLAEQVQICLHSLGIISRRTLVDPNNSKNEDRYSDGPYWRLEVWDCHSKSIFRDKIGFLTERKQRVLDSFKGSNEHSEVSHYNLVREFAIEAKTAMLSGGTFRECQDPRKWNIYRIAREGRVRLSLVRQLTDEFRLTNRLSEYVKRGFLFDVVTTVRTGEEELFDLSIPQNNTYLSNGIVSHNTMQHGGNVIVISTCVAPDTLINTADGLCEIKDLAPNEYDGFDDGYYYSDYDGPEIVGVDGLESATRFYKRPVEKTKIVTTKCGYEFEASLLHKLPVVLSDGTIGNKYVCDLDVGDFLPVKAGQMVFGDDNKVSFSKNNLHVDTITEDLAYLIGVIIAEGHIKRIDKYTANVTIACGDSSVLDKCEGWGDLAWNRGRVGQDYVTTCYTPTFVTFLEELGVKCTTAPSKTIPKRLLQCSEPVIRHFLRGLFDGDGSAHSRQGQVCYTSSSKKLIKQVRMLLFNYGIHTYLETSPPGTTSFRRENGEITVHDTLESYRLYVSNNFTELFYELIGFDLGRKQVLRENKTSTWSELMPPVTKMLLKELKDTTDLSISKMAKLELAPNVLYGSRSRITKNRLTSFMSKISYEGNRAYDSIMKLLEYDWFSEVKKLEESENEVYDFTLPKTHTFIGDCVVQANTNGVGDWYWSTCTDAEAGNNQFNPCIINWWDMDWAIEYKDPLSREERRIAPRDGIRKCRTKKEIDRFGPCWSPWLQEQYDMLQEQGEGWKFEQEILANFIGSGNTILDKNVISYTQTTIRDPIHTVTGPQTYVHPVSGEVEELTFDFEGPDEGLRVWAEPVEATPTRRSHGQIIDPGSACHTYVMGVDIATGKGRDYSAIEVLDTVTLEQVAEFMARCLPRNFVKYIDRIGRWYNCALAVVERNNGGDIVIDSLRYDYMYPRLWRKKDIDDKPRQNTSHARPLKVKPYGFATTSSSKPTLNKFLIDCIRDNSEEGYTIYSRRLVKQLQTYVRKRDKLGRDTNRTEAEDGAGNFDDLVIALGLGLIGASDATTAGAENLLPFGGQNDFKKMEGPVIESDEKSLETHRNMMDSAGPSLLAPMSLAPDDPPQISAQRHLDAYTAQLGGIPTSDTKPIITPPKWFYQKD